MKPRTAIDIGPGAGHLGGQIVASGTPDELKEQTSSLTGQYLSGLKSIEVPEFRRVPFDDENAFIEVKGAKANKSAKC